MFNKKVKKFAAVALAGTMALSMTACGGEETTNNETTPTAAPTKAADNTGNEGNTGSEGTTGGETTPTTAPVVDETPAVAPHEGAEPRTIKVGTWYRHYYDSNDTDIYVNPDLTDPDTAQMQMDNLRTIEEKYNVRIEFVNLTWEGTIESINNSIMAGTPDCDIYEVDLQFGIPAALNGYAATMEDYVPEDDDVWTDQLVFKYLDISGIEDHYLFAGNALDIGAYPLGFNMTMIDEAGLENPQDLYDRGEWTWDVFLEYCRKLTKDTDGDGNTDVWGYSGWWTTAFNYLLMSNGAHVAGGLTQELDSPATIEVLDLFYTLYQVDKTARPWDGEDWNINVECFVDGQVAFWTTAAWVQSGKSSADVGFEIGIVPWPIGPSGNKETNSQIAVAGNWYMIPVGVERPELVYAVMRDYHNWYAGDLEYRDDTEWAENMMETERNFEYLKEMGQSVPWFDLWGNVTGLEAVQKIIGMYSAEESLTPAQAAEQYKQIVQDFLDLYMN